MSFEHPEYLLWLAVLPIFILIYIIRFKIRQKRVKKWLGSRSDFLISSISETKRSIKLILSLAVLTLLFIALGRPQTEGGKIEAQNKGVYLLLLIDASNSMLAEDIKPNRLTFMKKEIARLIDLSSGDQIALGVFATQLYWPPPLQVTCLPSNPISMIFQQIT